MLASACRQHSSHSVWWCAGCSISFSNRARLSSGSKSQGFSGARAGAQQAVAAAGREWGDAAAAATERTEALQGLLRDNMAGGSPEGELRRLLASGGLSPALHQWLTASLGVPILVCSQSCHPLRWHGSH